MASQFSRPGKPIDSARVKSLNERLRQECLNAYCYLSLEAAGTKIGAWRTDRDESRPRSALDWATPARFARRCRLPLATATGEEPEVPTSEQYWIGCRVDPTPPADRHVNGHSQ